MAKSIKLKNETYIDSSSVVHNRDSLSNVINNINSQLSKSLMYKKWIDGSNFDFDDALETGIYGYSGYNGKYKDNPIPYFSFGLVVVFSANSYTMQIIFCGVGMSNIYIRCAYENKVYGNFRQLH